MPPKTLLTLAALGLSSLTLAGCVSDGEPYRSRPPVYREPVVEYHRDYRPNDYRPRRVVHTDRRDNRYDRRRSGDNRPICNERGCMDPNDTRFRN